MQTSNILGISLGTRTIGMAMTINGELVDWYIKAFKGKWSEQKKELILDTVDRMRERYTITSFAIKVPSVLENHDPLKKLYTEINLLAQAKAIKTDTYTIQTLKDFCGADVSNKALLRKKVLQLFPELKNEFNKEMENKNAYYTKLFEAAFAGYILSRSIQN